MMGNNTRLWTAGKIAGCSNCTRQVDLIFRLRQPSTHKVGDQGPA